MSDIKQIHVSGEALSSLTGHIKNNGGGKTRRRTKKVAGLPVRAVETLENDLPTTDKFNFIKHDTHIITENKENKENKERNEISQIKQNILPNNNIIKDKVKIIIAPKKKKEHRVILSRKHKNIKLDNKLNGGIIKNKTRKVSFNLLKHKKRLTRAKKIFDQSNKLSIDKIKKELISKNIIKPTSKAPELIIRQIYNDALVVANKVL